MIQRKLLMIAPYPIAKPLHGGQKRAAAIYMEYKSMFIEVKYVGVFHRGQYPDWDKSDLPIGEMSIIQQIDARPYASELITGRAIYEDTHVRSPLAKLLTEYQPDIIHIEQPFPYLGLKPLLSELNIKPKLIFGSQNIEYKLKQRIFSELNVPNKKAAALIRETKELEYSFSHEADMVIAVNQEDAMSHKQMGAKNCVIATNGIEKIAANNKEVAFWSSYKSTHKIKNIITFVGSGHPPNWEGFLDAVGEDTTFLPAGSKILVAGGVADYFKDTYKDKATYASFWAGIKLIGVIDDERLAALIQSSEVIILPIKTKRGSNLKTAEAILSAKKIVATSNTFNGFEAYRKLPNIYIADTKDGFKESIIRALISKYIQPTSQESKLSERVQWRYSLNPLKESVAQLASGGWFERLLSKIPNSARY